MPKASPQIYSFNGGELSPLLNGRQDLDKYPTGMSRCFNGIPLLQGGWTRRPGTAFLKTTKFGGTKTCRNLPFQYSVDQAYNLEFGDLYLRIFTEAGVLTQAAKNISAITKANPGVVTINAHGYTNGKRLHVSSVGGMTQLEGMEVKVANVTANTFELQDIYGNNLNTTNFDTFTSGGTVAEIFEVTTTYTEAELSDLYIVQSADVLYITHPSHAPAKLVRSAALTWTLSDLDLQDGPYYNLNITGTTLELSGTSGSVTVTASAATGINNNTGFQTTDVGRVIRFLDPANDWTWMRITARTSTTEVTATILGQDASAGTATANWRLGLYSTTVGYPRVAAFHGSRLVLAGAAGDPQRIDGSNVSDFENFAPTDKDGLVTDSHAYSHSLVSGRVNAIKWLQSQERGLIIGTSGSEFVVRASTQDEAITPSNVDAREVSAYGSADSAPVRVGDAILYVQRGKRKMREFAYVNDADGFRSPELTLLAEHITTGGVSDFVLQSQPQQILWGPREDGAIIGLTYTKEQNVAAWHRHQLGGVSDSSDNPAIVESICVIPSLSDTTGDNVFMVVKRYINGRAERYQEIFTKIWEYGDEQVDAFHFDAGLTLTASGAGTANLTGLYHLEGETLGVWADGTVQPDITITNGKATLQSAFNVITVGLKYNSIGTLMPLEFGAADGTSQGKIKRLHRIGFILLDTLSLEFGPADREDLINEILFRQWGQAWGTATPLFSGVVRERYEGDYDRLAQILFQVRTGAPATVLAVLPQGYTQDDT